MAAIDVKTPSENEEFDVKAGADTSQPSLSAEPANVETKPEVPVSAPVTAQPDVAAPTPAPAVTSSSSSSAMSGKASKHTIIEAVLVVLVLLLGIWAFSLMQQKSDAVKRADTAEKKVKELNNNPAIVEQRKTAELVGKVSALMELPKDETPQAALVSDAAALKKQYAFFSSVENGDQILFYYKAGKVIVYRPGTNKIVQTGPLTITQAQANTPAATTTKR
jgi:uncharacterized protein HemX